MSITGEPGRGPMRVGIPIADLAAGLLLRAGDPAGAARAGTHRRSGSGCRRRCSRPRSFLLDFQAARWLVDGEVPEQAGNDHPTSIPTGVYATSDGQVTIACAGQEIWRPR